MLSYSCYVCRFCSTSPCLSAIIAVVNEFMVLAFRKLYSKWKFQQPSNISWWLLSKLWDLPLNVLVTWWYPQASKPPMNAILHVHHVPNIPTNCKFGWFFLLYFPKLPKPPKPMGFSFVPYSMIRRRYILLYPEKNKNTEVDTSNDLNLVFQTVSDSTLFWDKQQAVCGIRSGSMSVIRNVISAHKRYHLGVVRMQNLTMTLRPSTWKKAQGLCQDKALCRPCLLPSKANKISQNCGRTMKFKEIQRRPRGVHSADLMLRDHKQAKTSPPKAALLCLPASKGSSEPSRSTLAAGITPWTFFVFPSHWPSSHPARSPLAILAIGFSPWLAIWPALWQIPWPSRFFAPGATATQSLSFQGS